MPTPKDRFVDLRGLPFHYRDWGGDGRPVLLLHGLASTCHIWDLVAPLLAEDLRIVAMDQRGHGQSAQVDEGYDFGTVLGDAAAMIDHLGWERPIIVGHSWGADVALELAVAHPQMAGGLIFVDGGTIDISSRPGWTLEQAREEMAPPIFTGFTPQMMRERVESSGRFGPNAPPETTEAVLANFRVLEDGTIQSNLRRENHLRIIDALWDHKPGELYPLPEMRDPDATSPSIHSGRPRAAVPAGGIDLQGRIAASSEQDGVDGGQHPRRAVAASRAGGERDQRTHPGRIFRLIARRVASARMRP